MASLALKVEFLLIIIDLFFVRFLSFFENLKVGRGF